MTSTEPTPPESMSTYERARSRFLAALPHCDPTDVVPACPAWTVHDLLAHQVHQLRAAGDGSFPLEDAMTAIRAEDRSERAAARQRQERWIRDGVRRLRARTPSVLVDDWDDACRQSDPAIRAALVPDIVVHLFDLFGVTRSRELRDDPMVAEALAFWASQLPGPIPEEMDDDFELLRVITGRRSREQARWAPERVALYGWRDIALDE
jgi:hypothetical protein